MLDELRNWWRADPWRIVGRKRWHYLTIYRVLRRGSWNESTGRWLAGGAPRGRLASLWGAIAFPHVHDDEDALDLEEIFGVSFDFWMNMERAYRDWLGEHAPGCVVDLRRHPDEHGIGTLAEENFIDVTRCEFCGGPLDAEHPWRRGMDGAAAHEACLTGAEGVGGDAA
jgi:hypothetical protein